MKGDLIMNQLRALVGDVEKGDLPLPFTAVATDVVSKKEVWLSRGDLFDAIRASIAIPAIFTPKLIDVPHNVCRTHEFCKAEQLIEAGRYWAREYLNRQGENR